MTKIYSWLAPDQNFPTEEGSSCQQHRRRPWLCCSLVKRVLLSLRLCLGNLADSRFAFNPTPAEVCASIRPLGKGRTSGEPFIVSRGARRCRLVGVGCSLYTYFLRRRCFLRFAPYLVTVFEVGGNVRWALLWIGKIVQAADAGIVGPGYAAACLEFLL